MKIPELTPLDDKQFTTNCVRCSRPLVYSVSDQAHIGGGSDGQTTGIVCEQCYEPGVDLPLGAVIPEKIKLVALCTFFYHDPQTIFEGDAHQLQAAVDKLAAKEPAKCPECHRVFDKIDVYIDGVLATSEMSYQEFFRNWKE